MHPKNSKKKHEKQDKPDCVEEVGEAFVDFPGFKKSVRRYSNYEKWPETSNNQ